MKLDEILSAPATHASFSIQTPSLPPHSTSKGPNVPMPKVCHLPPTTTLDGALVSEVIKMLSYYDERYQAVLNPKASLTHNAMNAID